MYEEVQNIGIKYGNAEENIWANDHHKRVRDINKFLFNPIEDKEKKRGKTVLEDYDRLFDGEIQRQRRLLEVGKLNVQINDQKKPVKLTPDEHAKNANVAFYNNCARKAEIPLPAFAKLDRRRLTLAEYHLSD